MTSLNFNPPIIAHRGASGYAPENTLVAFTKAAQLGIKWMEFDVMQAACGEPIVFHDELLDRTSNAEGDVSCYPYTYLQTLDAGAWFDQTFAGERIPSLRHTLEFLRHTKMAANLEIKALPGQEKQLIDRILLELSQEVADSLTILFSSFSIDALQYLRKQAPFCQIGLLLHEWLPHWEEIASALQCVSIHVNEEILTIEAAKHIKNKDKLLLCYTVNNPSRALELYSWGVDAVFSDVPDKILQVLRS